jgi:Flp pilus assembly protein TadD
LVIAAVGFLCYSTAFHGKFIWDDDILITENSLIKNWANFGQVFTRDLAAGAGRKFGFYRPVQALTYMSDYALWKYRPAGYHLTNILLHVLAALSLFWFVSVLARDERTGFLTALLFVVHPVHTEAVTYISGRADPLVLIFLLLSFIFYIKAEKRPEAPVFFALVLSAGLALLSRENSIVLPALLLLYHLAFRKKVLWPAWAAILALTLVYGVVRTTLFKAFLPDPFATTLWQRLPGVFVAIANYARLLWWPFGLHMEYGNPVFPFSEPRVWVGVALSAGCVVVGRWARRRDPLIFFALGWFFVGLLPVANLYPINAYMAEHWLYLPSVGFFIIISGLLAQLLRERRFHKAAWAVVAGWVVFCGILTVRQNLTWHEPVSFYMRTLKYSPGSPRALYNLANVYSGQGQTDQAIALYKELIDAKPDMNKVVAMAFNNLGNAYIAKDDRPKAREAFEEALRIDPGFALAYNNLGNVLAETGRRAESLPAYQKAIELDPDYADAYFNLGVALWEAGELNEAEEAAARSLRINPEQEEAFHLLAAIQMKQGAAERALVTYEKAVRVFPDRPAIFANLAAIYSRQGRHEEARRCADRARELVGGQG